MRIYHGPQNIGGMAGVLSSAHRAIGFSATSCCFSTGNYHYRADQEITVKNPYKRAWQLLKLLATSTINYDVFQFYYGVSLTGPFLFDLPILKKMNKKLFFYFCGCDIRDSKLTIEKYKYSACKECWPMMCSVNRPKAIDYALKYANAVFVSTPDLIEFVPNSILLPQPIDIKALELLKAKMINKKPKDHKIRIAHAPSNRKMKGTKYIEEAISILNSSGYQIEFLLIENTSYEEALSKSAAADLIIDQLLVGSYGQYSVEMMALGKPVVCYLREDLRHYYNADLPIINATPDNIVEVLKALLERKNDWSKIGQLGIDYVHKNHCSEVIAQKLIEYYKN